jgi:hypothetical protein
MRDEWGLYLSDQHRKVSGKEVTKAVGVKSCREAASSNNRFVHIHFKTMSCVRESLFYE